MFTWTFVDWCVETDRLCRVHLANSWAELAGDAEPPVAAFNDKESPSDFVLRFRERHDLEWLTPLTPDHVS